MIFASYLNCPHQAIRLNGSVTVPLHGDQHYWAGGAGGGGWPGQWEVAGTERSCFTGGGRGSWRPSPLALTPKLTVIGTSLPYPSKMGGIKKSLPSPRNDLDFHLQWGGDFPPSSLFDQPSAPKASWVLAPTPQWLLFIPFRHKEIYSSQ